jgi:hypothetical protein
MTFVYVLDAGAIVQLVRHNLRVACLLFDASAHGCAAAVPVTCVEAAAAEIAAAGWSSDCLKLALRAPVLKITPVPDANRPMMHTAIAKVGRPELAHAAVEALASRCRLLTTRPTDVAPLGLADWQVIAV